MSANVMEVAATELRITGRLLQETLGGLRRTGWMNLIIVITMASILSIFGTLFAFVVETQGFIVGIGSGLKISVYTKQETDLSTMVSAVKSLEHVKSVEVITKEQAWEEMKKNYQVPDIQNPLPDTLHVQMEEQRHIEPAVARLNELAGVEKVSYAQSVLHKLQKITRVTSFIGVVVSAFLGTLTLFIISNTIHLLIEARGREIEILRMMGVGNWYIRMPFLLQGAFYGLIGAVIAYAPLATAEYYINELFMYFQYAATGTSHVYVFLIMLLLGIGVGAFGAAISVHKYLRT